VTGQDSYSLLALALFPIIAGLITVALGHDKVLEMAGQRAEPATAR